MSNVMPLSPIDPRTGAAYVLGHHPKMLATWSRHLLEILGLKMPSKLRAPLNIYWPGGDTGLPATSLCIDVDDAIDELLLTNELPGSYAARLGRRLDLASRDSEFVSEAFQAADDVATWQSSLDLSVNLERLESLAKRSLTPYGNLERWREFGANVGAIFESSNFHDDQEFSRAVKTVGEHFQQLYASSDAGCPREISDLITMLQGPVSLLTSRGLLESLAKADVILLRELANAGCLKPWIVFDAPRETLTCLGNDFPFELLPGQLLTILEVLLRNPQVRLTGAEIANRIESEAASSTIGAQLSRIRNVLRPKVRDAAEKYGIPQGVAKEALILIHPSTSSQDVRYEFAVPRARIQFIYSQIF